MTVNNKRATTVGTLLALAVGAAVLSAPAAHALPGTGEVLRSKNAVLIMQPDGNLVLELAAGGVLWSTGTYGNPGATVTLQEDGNLVVHSSAGAVLWASGSYGNPGARLDLQSDGNLVLYRADGPAVWNTATWMVQPLLAGGEQLGTGNWTWSENAMLVMEQGGNLTIRDRDTHAVRGSSNTWGPGAYARMQADGNFVVYKKDGGEGKGGALWSTGTWNNPGARLVFERNGDLVVYQKDLDVALWRSGTGR
ncbi:hypothetical protein [Streptomyces bambusae]|uniref:Bulb-type lectin domain-containing protein n=1 Tax=Streptomyces bambusae TaxID=1550616 RepID=A0ABS6YZ01_9ACTN|nr:hypothetical protein [Streptomyces bambusae]MBW5480698.1 hypothetical protein [Streptomyces bambusae]